MSKSNTLIVVRRLGDETSLTASKKEAATLNKLHAYAERRAEDAKAAAFDASRMIVFAGMRLALLKSSLPHGEFGKWIKANCKFTDRTARNYMNLSDGVLRSLPVKDRDKVLQLAEEDPETISEAQISALDKALLKGAGTRELYVHYGLMKRSTTKNLTGGGEGGSGGDDDPNQNDAVVESQRLMTDVEDFVERGLHHDLPKSDRLSLIDSLNRTLKQLRKRK